ARPRSAISRSPRGPPSLPPVQAPSASARIARRAMRLECGAMEAERLMRRGEPRLAGSGSEQGIEVAAATRSACRRGEQRIEIAVVEAFMAVAELAGDDDGAVDFGVVELVPLQHTQGISGPFP